MNEHTEEARRQYWTQQMELAYGFMTAVREYPVEECGETLASMEEAVSAAGVEVLFSTSKIVDDFDRIFYMRTGLIDDFIGVARAMNERGWILKVEDGYRSVAMQTHLARKQNVFDVVLAKITWECGGEAPSRELLLRRLSCLVATSAKTGTHVSASAMDVSVYSRDDGSEIDRGGPYIELSERTPMTSPFVSAKALENRREITEFMTRFGFVAYPFEFWHYNKGDGYDEFLNKTGKPARYGPIHWDAATNTITPVENAAYSLQSPEDMEAAMAAAYERARAEA